MYRSHAPDIPVKYDLIRRNTTLYLNIKFFKMSILDSIFMEQYQVIIIVNASFADGFTIIHVL